MKTMGKRLRIYVAGPYKPKTNDVHDAPRLAFQNTRKAIHVGIEIIRKGHFPFIPHLTHFIHIENDKEGFPNSFWYQQDNVWLDLCDALYYIGSSRGADMELEHAKKKGLIIFTSLEQIPTVGWQE